jgi:D-apionolactonase
MSACAGAETLESLTFFETVGWHGVIERATGSPLPEKFPSAPGMTYPVYHVLADIGAFRGGQLVPITSSDPLRVRAAALQSDERRRLLIANLTGTAQIVTLPPTENGSYRLLDGDSYLSAALDPLPFCEQRQALTSSAVTLPPFGIMRVG